MSALENAGRWTAYVESLEHTVVLLCGNASTLCSARESALEYIREHPTAWSEFDTLRIVRQAEEIDVTLAVMGA